MSKRRILWLYEWCSRNKIEKECQRISYSLCWLRLDSLLLFHSSLQFPIGLAVPGPWASMAQFLQSKFPVYLQRCQWDSGECKRVWDLGGLRIQVHILHANFNLIFLLFSLMLHILTSLLIGTSSSESPWNFALQSLNWPTSHSCPPLQYLMLASSTNLSHHHSSFSPSKLCWEFCSIDLSPVLYNLVGLYLLKLFYWHFIGFLKRQRWEMRQIRMRIKGFRIFLFKLRNHTMCYLNPMYCQILGFSRLQKNYANDNTKDNFTKKKKRISERIKISFIFKRYANSASRYT